MATKDSEQADVRWRTAGRELSLPALRAFVVEVAADLDAGSRYPEELLAVLDAARDVEDYLRRLEEAERVREFQEDGSVASRGERGRSWVDGETWRRMDAYERTLSNLLTGETRMMWAGEGAADFARLPEVLAGLAPPLEVLSVPCSTGKEPFSLAIGALLAGQDVQVVGVDRQQAYVERARSGILVAHGRDREHPAAADYLLAPPGGPLQVAPAVLARCRFLQGDVLSGDLPAGPFALVSCRNLLGYFRGETLATAWRNVAARVRPGGVLLLDPFVSGAAEMALVRDLLGERGFVRRFAEANYYDAPTA